MSLGVVTLRGQNNLYRTPVNTGKLLHYPAVRSNKNLWGNLDPGAQRGNFVPKLFISAKSGEARELNPSASYLTLDREDQLNFHRCIPMLQDLHLQNRGRISPEFARQLLTGRGAFCQICMSSPPSRGALG